MSIPSVHRRPHIIPSTIARNQVLEAMHEIDERGIPTRRKSRDYCLIHEQRHYAPKYVLSIAAKYAIGRELEPDEFYGGECSTCANVFLRRRGFEVVACECNRVSIAEAREAIEVTESVRGPADGDKRCGGLFTEFMFEDLVDARPPREKGVYVIRIKNRSDILPEAMVREAKQLIAKLGWKMLERKMVSRIERLKKISQCPIIYIGGAGTQPGSRNTLKGRYTEFSGRHTAMYPIWILLYFGWKLQFGWKKTNQPEDEETECKEMYRKAHQDKLPALVKQ